MKNIIIYIIINISCCNKCNAQLHEPIFLLDGEWHHEYYLHLPQRVIYAKLSLDSLFCEPFSRTLAARLANSDFASATVMRFDVTKGEGVAFSNFERKDGKFIISKKPINLRRFKWNILKHELADSLQIFFPDNKYYTSKLIYIDNNLLVLIHEEFVSIYLRNKNQKISLNCQDIASILKEHLKKSYFK